MAIQSTDKLKKSAPVSLVLSDNSVYAANRKIDMVDGQFDKTTGAITLKSQVSRMPVVCCVQEIPVK